MELPIHLQIEADTLKLKPLKILLNNELVDFEGEPELIPLPFNATEIAAISRALNVNDTLEEYVSSGKAYALWGLGLLCDEPKSDKDTRLCKNNLNIDLKEWVTKKLKEALITHLIEIFTSFFECLSQKADTSILYVRLEMDATDVILFQYPWELLERDNSLGGNICISRYIRLPPPSFPSQFCKSTQLRILILHSEPYGLEPLLLQDNAKIREAISQATYKDYFEFEFIEWASTKALSEKLDAGKNIPTIVHFAGHGDFGVKCGNCDQLDSTPTPEYCKWCGNKFPEPPPEPKGYLAFTDKDTRRVDWVSTEEFCSILNSPNIQLVILNACKSALARGSHNIFNGVAHQLMYKRPAVIASPFSLENEAAQEFTGYLYQKIGSGLSLVQTMYETRRLMLSYRNEWYRPVLYLRSEQSDGGCLLDLSKAQPKEKNLQNDMPVSDFAAYMVDFKAQEDIFKAKTQIYHSQQTKQPLMFLIPGFIDAITVDGLAQRLHYCLKNICDYASKPTLLECNGYESWDELNSVLSNQMINNLVDLDKANTSIKLQDYKWTQPAFFYAYLNLNQLSPNKAVAFIKEFYRYWGNLAEQQHLLVICLFIAYQKKPVKPLLRIGWQGHKKNNQKFGQHLISLQPNQYPKLTGNIMPELYPIAKNEVDSWATEITEKNIVQSHYLERILQQIQQLFNERSHGLPMDELCNRLNEILDNCGLGEET